MADILEFAQKQVAHVLADIDAKLRSANGKLVLDFSAVRRFDAHGLRDMEKLAVTAEEKGVKVVLLGVSVEMYRVLKVMKLAPRFSFAAEDENGTQERWAAAVAG